MIILTIPDWITYKQTVIDTKRLELQYDERADRYEVYATEAAVFGWTTTIPKDGGAAQTDFEANFKANANNAFSFSSLTATFVATGASQNKVLLSPPKKHYSFVVIATGAVTSWSVSLELSLTGNAGEWSSVATHTQLTGSGQIVVLTTPVPAAYLRFNCSALVLGAGTSITAKVLGIE